ncbi:nuclease-related domain-containing protein [Bacillus sp. J33]|uniref:nuclease-related domain-containing protein n=1 Tax=Bacillus sp. J33 TaxID=935836 RepID=UPI00047A4273|nr:nuclease-related domain-containing protein [Bacillus sp. J33]
MIYKTREISISIQKLQALARRVPRNHPKWPIIEENLLKSLAGYKGESALDFPLSFLPQKKYYIMHDLRLSDSQHFFQIDTLVVSKNYVLILEVKNIAGTLFFDQEFHQLIRIKNGHEKAFPDPLIQVQRQETQLKKWLSLIRIPELPIHSLVIISNPGSIIKTAPRHKNLHQKVIHREFLPERIVQLENLYRREHLSEKELKKLLRLFNKHHEASNIPILKKYQITQDQLLKGVHCPHCGYLPLKRIYGTWNCPSCNLDCKDAHKSSLNDYSLLIGNEITNAECRNFLLIGCPSLASRLLRSAAKDSIGKNKGKCYIL